MDSKNNNRGNLKKVLLFNRIKAFKKINLILYKFTRY